MIVEPNAQSVPEWLPSALVGAWNFFAAYPPVLALIVAVVGIGLAVLVRWVILFSGLKVTAHIPGVLGDRLLKIVAGVVALLVAYLALVLAVQVVGFNDRVEQIVIRVLLSILILHLMRAAIRAGHVGLEILGTLRDRYAIVEERTIPLFDLVMTIIIVAMAAYAMLQVWNIDATAWLASAGIVGIVVGFAARDTLANLFAGFFIIADAPYKLGDYIVLDNGHRGEVTKVGIRSTRILTRDDVEITVPNSEMANAKIYNESGGRWVRSRTRLKIGVAYGSDVDQVVEVLERVASEHGGVCSDPTPRVRMRGFGDSSLDFELMCWIDHPSERGRVAHQLFMQIYKDLNREGIQIPFPQRDIWMRNENLPSDSDSDAAPESSSDSD